MWQLYIDDSGTHSGAHICILAGFLGADDQFDQLRTDWTAICTEEPATPDFKMEKAIRFRRSIWGDLQEPDLSDAQLLARRNGRFRLLLGAIVKSKVLPIGGFLVLDEYNEVFRGQVPPEFDDPYFPIFYSLLFGVSRYLVTIGEVEPVDLVFDYQEPQGFDALRVYDDAISQIPPEAARLLSNRPRFVHDNVDRVLQAADMHAWYIHRANAERLAESPVLFPIANDLPFRQMLGAGMGIDLNRETLQIIVDSLNGRL